MVDFEVTQIDEGASLIVDPRTYLFPGPCPCCVIYEVKVAVSAALLAVIVTRSKKWCVDMVAPSVNGVCLNAGAPVWGHHHEVTIMFICIHAPVMSLVAYECSRRF